jgi:hypothetical protein
MALTCGEQPLRGLEWCFEYGRAGMPARQVDRAICTADDLKDRHVLAAVPTPKSSPPLTFRDFPTASWPVRPQAGDEVVQAQLDQKRR